MGAAAQKLVSASDFSQKQKLRPPFLTGGSILTGDYLVLIWLKFLCS
jgi:hypothetical protein